jgi:competence protein ComGC
LFSIRAKKGFTVNNIVVVIVAIIMLVAVAIPVTQDVIDSANLTGTAATVTSLLPLLLAVGGVIVVTALYRSG